MSNQSCIFCKIIAQEIPARVIARNDHVLVIKDIAPKAPIHYLIIPHKHIATIADMHADDAPIAGYMALMAQQLSKMLPVPGAFRLIINNGAEAGQSVFHLHAHFVSGKKMLDF